MENIGLKLMDKKFWKGKRVFLTGHTGFKGCWMSLWLSSLGAVVKGYSLSPVASPSLFQVANIEGVIDSTIGDIRDINKLKKSMVSFKPDIVIHMAAQPLVRYSYQNPVETYEVNVLGTVNVLEAARLCDNLKVIVNITTDKCYKNKEANISYKEDDPLGGYDPYSSSKGCAELITSSYRNSYMQSKGIGLASVRAGNVIGGGDWADDRLIPDILRAFEKNEPVSIRNPESVRPWQHVLEPLSGYIILAQKMYGNPDRYSEAWNFGPIDDDARPVSWILNRMINKWGGSGWVTDKDSHPHEAMYLRLDISKAKKNLGWEPVWDLDEALDSIISWHHEYLCGKDMRSFSLDQIHKYQSDMLGQC
jgi:CDP-glucose 4,6-dehydratase